MRSAWTATPLLAASVVHALPEFSLSKRGPSPDYESGGYSRALFKRAGTVTTDIFDVLTWSEGGAYYLNVTVGTPPQAQTVILDTGSSDLYFDASSAAPCKTTGQYSCQGGTFDSSKSSTYNVVQESPAFNTSFGDGSYAVGPYSTDTVAVGDVSISNVQFGVGEQVNSTTGYAIGLMGIGYSANEASAYTEGESTYPNIPEVLVDAGVINSRLYSIFLNDQEDVSGTILFGGIDTSKYTGELATLDLLPTVLSYGLETENLGVTQFVTTVTAVSATIGGKTTKIISGGTDGIGAYGNSDPALAVLLDTGSTDWSVDENTYNKYFAPVFTFVDEDGTCPCSYANSQDTITLTFGGKVSITVPAREWIVPYYDPQTRKTVPYPNSNDATCVLLIAPAPSTGEGFQTLGDAILRSMYVVFDLDNGQVSIAQAANGTTASPNVVTVSAGASGVANAVKGVSTASSNTWSIAPAATNTASFGVSTLASTIGTATGDAAVPYSAQTLGAAASNGGGSGSGAGSGASSSTSGSKGAAAQSLTVPGGSHFGALWSCGLVLAAVVVGAASMAL